MLTPEEREEALQKRLAHLADTEAEVRQKEKALKEKEKAKKQVPLRLSATLWEELAAWAEEDFPVSSAAAVSSAAPIPTPPGAETI